MSHPVILMKQYPCNFWNFVSFCIEMKLPPERITLLQTKQRKLRLLTLDLKKPRLLLLLLLLKQNLPPIIRARILLTRTIQFSRVSHPFFSFLTFFYSPIILCCFHLACLTLLTIYFHIRPISKYLYIFTCFYLLANKVYLICLLTCHIKSP